MIQAAAADMETQENSIVHPELITNQYVLFDIDEYSFAIPVMMVERIVHAVKISNVPNMPSNICGVINVHGKVIPVFNIRRIFGLPDRKVKLGDQLIIASSTDRRVAFMADRVTGVTERTEQQVVPADDVFPGMQKILEGLIFYEDGLILIYKLDKLFDMDTEQYIDLTLMQKANASSIKAGAEENVTKGKRKSPVTRTRKKRN